MSFLEPVNTPRHPATTGSDLRRMAEQQHADEVREAGLTEHVNWATVYVETRPDTEQIVIHHDAQGQWVHAYSEYGLLPDARHGAEEVWHRHLTGAELRRQIPAHIGIVLDHGLPHERVVFPPKAVPIDLEEAE